MLIAHNVWPWGAGVYMYVRGYWNFPVGQVSSKFLTFFKLKILILGLSFLEHNCVKDIKLCTLARYREYTRHLININNVIGLIALLVSLFTCTIIVVD